MAIEKLKTKIETALIKRATEETRGAFDYKIAHQIPKKAIVEKLEEKKYVESKAEKHWLA